MGVEVSCKSMVVLAIGRSIHVMYNHLTDIVCTEKMMDN